MKIEISALDPLSSALNVHIPALVVITVLAADKQTLLTTERI
jgi:hypothetical protein